MSEETDQDLGEGQQSEPKMPHSWVGLFMGVVSLVIAAIACVYLLASFLQSRPVDLTQHATALADYTEQLLEANRVPGKNINRSPAKPHEEDAATWASYRMDVTLPPTLGAEGLERLITRDLTERGVSVVRSADEQSMASNLKLSMDGRAFVDLHLTGGMGRLDLTESCDTLAKAVRSGLKTCELIAYLGSAKKEAQKDKTGIWNLWHIEGGLAQNATGKDVAAKLRKGIVPGGVRVVEVPGQASPLIRIVQDGKTCIELRLAAPPSVDADEVPLPLVNLPGLDEAPTADDGIDSGQNSAQNQAAADSDSTAPLFGSTSPMPRTGARKPRVSIILDDGGYGGPVTDAVMALDKALTIAILPDATYTKETVRRAKERGFELMLHMPMESNSKTEKYPGWLTANMPRDAMAKATEAALAQVPGAVGVNNHIGSKFTENETAMRAFLALMKKHNLYFVDSRTTAESKAYDLAKAMQIRAGVRNVFIDHEKSEAFIRQQFEVLVKIAREKGHAIGICHFHPTTVAQLAKLLPGLKAQGIELVPVSELVQ